MLNRIQLISFLLIVICQFRSGSFAQCPAIPIEEAIVNGDFEAGATGFLPPPGYTVSPYGAFSGPKTYQISTNVDATTGNSTFNAGNFDNIVDHTQPDGLNGQFLLIDADNTSGTNAWQTTVNVYPNQTYYFSAYVTNLYSAGNPPILEFQISGGNTGTFTPLGVRFSPNAQGAWIQSSATWSSAAFTTATIRIVDFNSANQNGNDFGLDDISFINGCQNTTTGPVPDLIEPKSLCLNGDVVLSSRTNISSGAPNIYWQQIGVRNLPAYNGQTSITVSTPGKYQVCVDYAGCIRSSIVEVKNDIIVDVPDQTICNEKTTILDTKLTGSELQYVWKKGTAIVGASTPSYTVPVGGAGNYSVTVSSKHSSCAGSSKTDNIVLIGKDCYQISATATPANPCVGSDVILTAVTNGYIEKWVDGNGVNLGNTRIITVNPPAANNDYTVTAKFPVDTVNKNGDFENGFNDFTSGFSKRTDNQFQNGDYLLVKGNETYLQEALQNTTDISGTGKMLLVKGANDKNTLVIYSQTVAVTNNTDYGVSFYLKNLIANLANSAPVDLELRINGVKVMEIHNPLDNNWRYYSYLFKSTSTSLTIDIVGMNTYNEYKFRILAFDNIHVGLAGASESANVTVNTSDCRTLTAMADTTICLGATLRLSAITNGFITKWTPSADLSDPTSTNPFASISGNTTFTVEAKYPVQKYLSNPAFSDGDAGFTSGLTKSSSNQSPQDNQYYVGNGNDSFLNYPFQKPTGDHTSGNGTGQFLIARTKTAADRIVLSQTISAVSGASYAISFWTTDMHQQFTNSAPISFQIRVGGTVLKTVTYSQDRLWRKTEHSWTATTTGNILVEIISPKEASGDRERAFGLDDVTLAQLGNAKTDDVNVTVNDCFNITAQKIGTCKGDSIQIEAETNGLFQGWTVSTGGEAGIKTPKSLTTWVKPGTSTTYVATARIQLGNLITNGDFESGDTGFSSDYTCCLNTGGGHYSVDKDPYVVTNGASWTIHKTDHTTGKGNMYLSDGGSDPTKDAYKTTVNVVAGKQYAFSAWFANIHSEFIKPQPDTNAAKTTYLSFYINGQLNTAIKLPLDTAWHQYYATWTSPLTGLITLEVRNKETSGTGNDFALDDIVFAPLYTLQKTANVNVSCVVCNKPTSVTITNATQPMAVCENSSLNLTGNFTNKGAAVAFGGMYYSWYKVGATPAFTQINPNPAGTGIIAIPGSSMNTLSLAASGKYVLRIQDGNNVADISCASTDTVQVLVSPSTIIIKQPKDTVICEGVTLNLVVSATGTGPFSYQWKQGTNNVGTDSRTYSKASAVAADAGNYTVVVTGGCGTPVTGNPAAVTVNTKPLITTQPAAEASDCAGGTVTLNAAAGGTPAPTFQWSKTGPLAGKTAATLTLANLALADAGSYTVTATNSCGTATSTASVVSVTTNVVPSVGLTLSADKICGDGASGRTITLTASPTGGGTAPAYIFKESTNAFVSPGQPGSTFVYTVPANTGTAVQNLSFTAEMTSNSGCIQTGSANPAVSTAKAAQVDAEVKATNVNITENKLIICTDTRNLTVPALPGGAYSSTWSTTGGASVTGGAVTGIATGTQTLTTYKVESPLKLCPSAQDTVTTVRAGDLTNPNPVTSNNKRICSSTANPLLAGISPLNSGETGTWTVTAGETATVTAAGQTGSLKVGVNRFVYTVANSASGCPADTALVSIYVDSPPTAATAGTDKDICTISSILDGSVPVTGTGLWTANNSSVTFDDATDPKATAGNIPKNVTVKLTWTISNPVCPVSQDEVEIKQIGDMTSPLAGTDQTICGITGLTVNLSGNTTLKAGETVTWTKKNTGDPGTLAQSSNNATVSGLPLTAGSYIYVLTMTNGGVCPPATDEVTVNIIAAPIAVIVTPSGRSVTYRDNAYPVTGNIIPAGYRGQWVADSTGILIGDTTTNSIGVSLPAFNITKTVRWIVRDAGRICPNAEDTVIITRKDFTVADLEPDKTICETPSGNFTLEGNSYNKPNEYVTWSVKSGGASIQVPNSADSTKATFTLAATGSEQTLEFYYTITNKVLGRVTRDSVTVKINAETQVPVLQAGYTGTTSAAPYLLCSSSINLPGVAATQGRNWWKSATLSIPVTDSTATPAVTVPAGPGSATFYYRNGVCPEKATAFFFEKMGDVTPAQVTINGGKPLNVGKQYIAAKDSIHKLVNNTADTLCIGGDYTLTARALKTGETGTWSIATAGTISFDPVNPVTSPTQKLIVGGPGETQLKWSVKNTSPLLASCPANETTIKLVVHDIPTGGIIDGNAFVCEGTDTLYKVNPVASSTLTPVTYTWDAGTPGASRTGSATGASTRYKFTSDAAGTITQGTVQVTAGNACGSAAPVSKVVTIRLAPRNFTAAPGNTDAKILGPKVFCATETLVGYKLDEIQQNVDGNGYRWYWDNKLITARTDTAAIGIGQVTNWDPSLNSTHTIKVELTNHCSDTARIRAGIPVIFKDTIVKVIAPAPVTVNLSSDKMGNKFCVPDDQVIFTPTISTTLTGLVTDYTFKVDGVVQQGPGILSTYTVGRNFLKDGAKVTVELSPAASQCINYSPGGIPSNIVEMEGFQYPDSIITGADTICEQKSVVMLNVSRSATLKGSLNDNGGISWYKDGALMSPQPSGFSLSLTNPSETGRYTVKVTGSVCATHTSVSTDTARVKIFEQPRIIVLKNPYAVPYVEGVNAFTMPVYVPELARDTFTTKTYVPEIWLRDPKEPGTVLVPEREEKTQPYWLNLATGNPDANGVYGGCRAQEMIVIVYYLPVIIPNAFTPNGDGLNDTWVITGLGKYPNTKVKVYNRWGTAMYVDNDGYRAVWDGTHNGQPLPTGTYYYIVELKGSPDGTDENRTGHLTIIR